MRLISAGSLQSWTVSLVAVLVCVLEAFAAERECDYGLKVLWSAKLRDSPLTATPLLFDVDRDGYDDIVVPSFTGEVWAVHGESGHIVDNWPFYLEDRAFHASPLVYDLNGDGVLEFILTTTDGEVLFLQSDNTFFHGETLKIPPLRVERFWYEEEKEYAEKLAAQMRQITGDDQIVYEPQRRSAKSNPPRNVSKPFSEFESKFGRHADPLFSFHQPERPPSGVDPKDENFIFVDPHVLATPTLVDLNGDGEENELVVPVSYYFDPIEYGRHEVGKSILNGLQRDKISNYVGGGLVVFDLKQHKIVNQKTLSMTRVHSDQPGYVLSTPTVVKLSHELVVLVGTATGELHMLRATDLTPMTGFPQLLDSISSQVAVADLFGTGALHIVVGDHSGNVYCIDEMGKRVWEQEANVNIVASIRFADIERDGKLEVVLNTQSGDLWILNGQDGTPYPPNYPLHLNIATQASPLLMHLNSTAKGGGRRKNGLAVVMATSEGIYIIDTLTMCMDKYESEHIFMEVLSGDIDPYSPGLELLAISLDGYMVCFSTASSHMGDLEMSLESWGGDALGQNGFTHKSNSFALILPHANDTIRDISGSSFNLVFQIYQYRTKSEEYSVKISIGRKMTLYKGSISARQRTTDVSLSVPTPPTPLRSFVTIQICNEHAQCNEQSYIVNFNLHFEDNLKWLLALPFVFLCVYVLWTYRDAGGDSLPTVASSDSRKNL